MDLTSFDVDEPTASSGCELMPLTCYEVTEVCNLGNMTGI